MINGVRPLTRPDVKAKITYISDDKLSAGGGQPPYFAAQLEFVQSSLKTLGGVALKPGMSASLSITTKPRTPFIDMADTIRMHFVKSRGTR